MKKKIFLTVVLLSCFLVSFALIKVSDLSAKLSGKWSGVITTTNGEECPLSYSFKAQGNDLTGTATSPQGDAEILNGKIEGTDVSFTISFKGQDVKHTGKYYADADSIGMNLDLKGFMVHTTLKKSN